jgi:uncharacterized membrane protein
VASPSKPGDDWIDEANALYRSVRQWINQYFPSPRRGTEAHLVDQLLDLLLRLKWAAATRKKKEWQSVTQLIDAKVIELWLVRARRRRGR